MPDPYQSIIDVLSRSKRVLITTHVRPDGDALGTTAAMSLALRKQNIDSEVLLLTHIPHKYEFVYHDNGIKFHDVEKGWPGEAQKIEDKGSRMPQGPPAPTPSSPPSALSSLLHPRSSPPSTQGAGKTSSVPSLNPEPRTLNPFFQSFDSLLVCDTGTWSQLPGLRERIEGWNVPRIVLDHHLTQEDWATHKLVIPEAAAAGEIAAELLEAWEIPLDLPIATALYLAIASDTGWFQFSNTRPFTMRLAATLMEAGVNTDEMYKHLYQSERPQRVALQTRAMQSLELLSDNRLAVMTIAKRDFDETGAGVPATENLINIPLQVEQVEVSLLFVEPPEGGPIRVSLRSKGGIDVAKFAEQFGGGGHARASGLKLATTLADAHTRVVAAATAALSQSPSA
jgi:phosphoesterase RecJ-like protein